MLVVLFNNIMRGNIVAIYTLTAEFKTSDGRKWRSHWSRKACGMDDAIKRGKRDIESSGGDWMKVKASFPKHQLGTHFIGNSGRMMMVECKDGVRGDNAQVRHVVNGEIRTIGELGPVESDFVWARVWDL